LAKQAVFSGKSSLISGKQAVFQAKCFSGKTVFQAKKLFSGNPQPDFRQKKLFSGNPQPDFRETSCFSGKTVFQAKLFFRQNCFSGKKSFFQGTRSLIAGKTVFQAKAA
jgi:hypothetical protein